MTTNGKSYTEVVLEFTNMLTESERRQTQHNIDVMERLGRGDEKFKAINDKVDTGCVRMDKKIDENKTDIKTNADNIVKVRNLNATLTAFFSGIAAFIGFQR